MRTLRRSLERLHRYSAFLPQQSLLAGIFKTIGCGGGGGGRRGDARTVPSIKVSSAFVYLGKNNSSLSSNPRIFEMNLS